MVVHPVLFAPSVPGNTSPARVRQHKGVFVNERRIDPEELPVHRPARLDARRGSKFQAAEARVLRRVIALLAGLRLPRQRRVRRGRVQVEQVALAQVAVLLEVRVEQNVASIPNCPEASSLFSDRKST